MSFAKAECPEIVVEFFGEPPDSLYELGTDHPDEVTLIEAKGFGATAYTLQALVILTPIVGKQIATIIRAHIEARKHVRIRADGIEIAGLDAEDAIKVLRELQPGID
jgi:hypothetical protein